MNKTISPAAVNALKEALTNIYWFKPQLRSFITNCLSGSPLLSTINWDDIKRNYVSDLIDRMVANEDRHQEKLLELMRATIQMDDFSHLRRVEDGVVKEKAARDSVAALRKLMSGHLRLEDEKEKTAQRREKAEKKLRSVTEVNRQVDAIRSAYMELVIMKDRQEAGRRLEAVLRGLFEIHDLDPKASFKIVGEQIDGAFRFENTDFLLEAKWWKKPVDAKELDSLHGKIRRKLENTLGLFISISGFSDEAVIVYSADRKLILLMDGADLMGVLDGRIGLIELIQRKKIRASRTGEVYFRLDDILAGK